MKQRHKWLLAVGVLIMLVAWLAWTLLTAESDLAPHGSLQPPRPVLASALYRAGTGQRPPGGVPRLTGFPRA